MEDDDQRPVVIEHHSAEVGDKTIGWFEIQFHPLVFIGFVLLCIGVCFLIFY